MQVASARLTPASTAVTRGTTWVPIEALPAIVAVAASSIVSAVEADTATAAAGQSVQLHVKAAAAGMAIAGASCREVWVRGRLAGSKIPRPPSKASPRQAWASRAVARCHGLSQ